MRAAHKSPGLHLVVLCYTPLLIGTCCWSFDPSTFPVSTRQALESKAQQLNNKDSYGQYSPAGWSNRAATALTPVHPDGVYTADRPFYWNSIDVSCRCTIIELPSSSDDDDSQPDLWVHSPVGLDGPLQAALQNTGGKVQYVVSPNYEHVKFAPAWQQAFPSAQMWACPGLAERLPDIAFAGEIPAGYRPVSWTAGGARNAADNDKIPWDTTVLQPLHINCERNPFTGRPFFNEVVFYHAPTKTLLVTDLWWNYPANTIPNSQFGRDDSWALAPADILAIPVTSRLWKFGMDAIYKPFFDQFMVTDRQVYRDIADHIVNVWDVEMVIPAHGDIVRGKEVIADILRKHFRLE